MMHGLEHLLDPRQSLLQAKTNLATGQYLYLETPNFIKLKELMPIEKGLLISKLYSFDEDNVSLLLKDCGFEIVKIEHNHPIHMSVLAKLTSSK